jgi:hypothetical protein
MTRADSPMYLSTMADDTTCTQGESGRNMCSQF